MLCQHLPAIGADLCARLRAMVLRSRGWLLLQWSSADNTEALSWSDFCSAIGAGWALRRFRDRDRDRLRLWLWFRDRDRLRFWYWLRNWFRDRFRYWLWYWFRNRLRGRSCMFDLSSTIYTECLIWLYRRAAIAAHLSPLRRYWRRGWSRMFNLGSAHITEHGVLRDLRMAVGAEDHAFYPLDLSTEIRDLCLQFIQSGNDPGLLRPASSPLSFSFL